jgi:hypothetical protein
MHDRVKRSGAQAVAVTRQLLDHAQAKDWFLTRVMENVQPDQP